MTNYHMKARKGGVKLLEKHYWWRKSAMPVIIEKIYDKALNANTVKASCHLYALGDWLLENGY